MKHTIITAQARITVEASHTLGLKVQIKVKPLIWPEVQMTLEPHEAAAIAEALDLCAAEAELPA